MVYAESSGAYGKCYRSLQSMRCPQLQSYFDDNWHNIQEQWVGYLVNQHLNFGDRSNNRLESLNQKIKSVVTKYSNLGRFFDGLITLTTSYNVERDHVAADNVMRKPLDLETSTEYDKKYAEHLTTYAYKKYIKQSMKSPEIRFTQIREADAECFENNLRIEVHSKKCSCSFFKTMYLPCAHIIALLALREEPILDPELCANRWKRAIAQYINEYDYIVSNDIPTASQLEMVTAAGSQPRRNMTANDKFRAAERETKKICEIYAEKSQEEFNVWMKKLKEFRVCVEIDQIPG